MEYALELLKIVLPCALTVLAVYLVLDRMLKEREEANANVIRAEEVKVLLPLLLQAYERLNLFLERIAIENIILRLHQQGMSGKDLQTVLIKSVADEFEHNIAQQTYVSEESWRAVKFAKDEVIRVVNRASGQVGPAASAIDLSQKVFEIMSEMEQSGTQAARKALKAELNSRLKYY